MDEAYSVEKAPVENVARGDFTGIYVSPHVCVDGNKQSLKVIINESLVIVDPLDLIQNEVIEANTFRNPKFDEAAKYGRSTWNIPASVKTFRIQENNLVVERGYCHDFFDLLTQNHIEYELEDERACPLASYPLLKGISLRPYQKRAIDDASKHSQGILIAPTGSGKSIMGLELIRRKQTTALIIVHKKELAAQWQKEIKRLFGFEPGLIGDGKFKIGKRITIAMAQTLARREDECKELAGIWGLVLIDEAHHCPAEQFSTIINWLPCKYRYGLSATIARRDGLDCLIFRAIGPIIAKVSKEEVEHVGSVIPVQVTIVQTHFKPGLVNGWHEYLDSINNAERNMLIIGLIPKGKSTLILVDRIAHAEDLSSMLCNLKTDHVLAHGALQAEERATLMKLIKQASLTVGTTGLLGEGLDVAHWDTLILAHPISSEVKLSSGYWQDCTARRGQRSCDCI